MLTGVGLYGRDFFFSGHRLEARNLQNIPHASKYLRYERQTLNCGAFVQCTHHSQLIALEPGTTSDFLIPFITWNINFFLKKISPTQPKPKSSTKLNLDKSSILLITLWRSNKPLSPRQKKKKKNQRYTIFSFSFYSLLFPFSSYSLLSSPPQYLR